MKMTAEIFTRNNRSIAWVMDYIGHHLNDELSLARLADMFVSEQSPGVSIGDGASAAFVEGV